MIRWPAGFVIASLLALRSTLGGQQPAPRQGPTFRSGDQVVFSKREDLPRLGGQTTYPTVTEISLLSFDPGDYILTVEAKSSLAPDRPVSRQIPFSVTDEP